MTSRWIINQSTWTKLQQVETEFSKAKIFRLVRPNISILTPQNISNVFRTFVRRVRFSATWPFLPLGEIPQRWVSSGEFGKRGIFGSRRRSKVRNWEIWSIRFCRFRRLNCKRSQWRTHLEVWSTRSVDSRFSEGQSEFSSYVGGARTYLELYLILLTPIPWHPALLASAGET